MTARRCIFAVYPVKRSSRSTTCPSSSARPSSRACWLNGLRVACAPAGAAPAAELPRPRIILSFDGEKRHLDATLEMFIKDVPDDLREQGFELLKFAASASKTQQPCDVAPVFMIMRTLYKFDMLHRTEAYGPLLESTLLASMDSGSRKTFVSYLQDLPTHIHKAFNPDHVRKGWDLAGIYPYNPIKILKRCTTVGGPRQGRPQGHRVCEAVRRGGR
eukprot:m.90967 g.90967  ORF g.90967 m.90967 type:complete len:217 (+) comp8482_c0_seq3:704-1354(+)